MVRSYRKGGQVQSLQWDYYQRGIEPDHWEHFSKIAAEAGMGKAEMQVVCNHLCRGVLLMLYCSFSAMADSVVSLLHTLYMGRVSGQHKAHGFGRFSDCMFFSHQQI